MKNELVVYSRPKSNISEDIRTIRTNLQFASVDKNLKTERKMLWDWICI